MKNTLHPVTLTHLGTGDRLLGLFGTELLHGVVVLPLLLCHEDVLPALLLLLLVEVLDDDTDEEVQSEETSGNCRKQ